MKKTKLTRSLMAACSIVALSAVMYGCVHSGDDTAMDDPPPPPAAVNLMGSTDLMPGMTTIPAGGSVTVGYTTLSCDGDEACALTVERDEVTGQLTATSTGGTVTVAYSPPADPTVNMVDLMGSPDLMAGTTTIAAGGSVTVGNTVVSCPAGGEDCVLTVAEDMVTGMMTATSTGGAATVAYTPPPEPTVHALNLPDGHGLGVGTVTLQPGESHTSGRTVITCPDGGDPCVVELTENDVTGVVSATSTGALAMVSITPLPAGLAALQAFGAAMDAAAAGAGDALDEPTLRAAFSSTVGNNGITTSYATHGNNQSRVTVTPMSSNTPATNNYAGGAEAPEGRTDDEQDEIDATMAAAMIAGRDSEHTIAADTTGNAAVEWEVMGDPGDTLTEAVSGGRTLAVDFMSDFQIDLEEAAAATTVLLASPTEENPAVQWNRLWFANSFFNNLGEGQERIIPENTGGDQNGHPPPLHGMLDGVPGTFSCGTTACTMDRHDSDGTVNFNQDVTFTPYTDAMVFTGHDDWLSAGIWMVNPEDNEDGNFEFGMFMMGGDPFGLNADGVFEAATLNTVVGDATYEGSAIGRYARNDDGDTDTGLFSADAELTAAFGAADAFGSVEGELTNFMLGDSTTAEDWGVSLEENVLIRDTTDDGDLDDPLMPTGAFGGDTSGHADGHTVEGAWWGQFFGTTSPGEVVDPTNSTVMIDSGHPGGVAGVFMATDSTAGDDYTLTLGGGFTAEWESGDHTP